MMSAASGNQAEGGTAAVLREMDDSPSELAPPAMSIVPDTQPTILVVGMAEARMALADCAERAGLRCIGQIGPEVLIERLALTVAVDLILLDLRGAGPDGGLDGAAARALAARSGLPDARLAILTDLAGLDCIMARFDAADVEILCEPARSEIVSLLVMAALAAERDKGPPQLHDATRESEAARLEKLSDEVRRLASTIERLTQNGPIARPDGSVRDARPSYRSNGAGAGNGGGAPEASPAERFRPRERAGSASDAAPTHTEIRAVLRARRLREQFLPAELFADPAWDMILDLLAARLAGQRVSVSSLCIAAAVPPTTALRWIRQLTDRGVFARIDDPADGRRVFIELTDGATDAVIGWTHVVRRNGGLLAGAGRH